MDEARGEVNNWGWRTVSKLRHKVARGWRSVWRSEKDVDERVTGNSWTTNITHSCVMRLLFCPGRLLFRMLKALLSLVRGRNTFEKLKRWHENTVMPTAVWHYVETLRTCTWNSASIAKEIPITGLRKFNPPIPKVKEPNWPAKLSVASSARNLIQAREKYSCVCCIKEFQFHWRHGSKEYTIKPTRMTNKSSLLCSRLLAQGGQMECASKNPSYREDELGL